MSSVAINSRASRCSLRRRRANLLAWVSNISLFVRVCQNKSLHLLSAKIECACRKILKTFLFFTCFVLSLHWLISPRSGRVGQTFWKGRLRTLSSTVKLRNFEPKKIRQRNVHFGRLLHPILSLRSNFVMLNKVNLQVADRREKQASREGGIGRGCL